jgi:adenosylcobinamide-phosphate synthase
MGVTAAAAVAASLALDAAFAEPPARVHPVALFGRAVAPFDREWRAPTAVGVAVAVVLPVAAAAAVWGVTALASRASVALGAAVAALVLFSTTSLRMLLDAASDVVEQSERDPEEARASVRALVGRDPSALSPGELRSAAAESAAENLADGLVAPLAAFAVGAQVSLAAAAAAAAWVKAVNTLDSMLGYRSKPVGAASARLDDAAMWLPARISAVLVALAARSPAAVWRARAWRAAPASPNSGWPMATLAGALDVELRKPGQYDLNPDADLPTVEQGHRGVRVVGVAGVVAYALAGVVAWL